MKRFRVFILLLLLLIIVFIVVFRFGQGDNKNSKIYTLKRIYKQVVLTKAGDEKFSSASRLFLSEADSFIIYADTIAYIISPDISTKRKLELPKDNNQVYFYIYKNNDTLITVDWQNKMVNFKYPDTLYQVPSINHLAGGIYNTNSLFLNKLILGKKVSNTIEQWDNISRKWINKIDLQQIFAEELKHCKECTQNSLEGSFFAINDRLSGFYFYRGGYFILLDSNKSYKLKKTIIEHPFIVFENKKVEMNGGVMGQCQANPDTWVQMSACGSDKGIFILSNIIGKGFSERCIDVYSKDDGVYQYSFAIPNLKDEKPTEILSLKNNLIVFYDNGTLVSYKMSL